jgi:hypothetical protein
MHTYIRSNECLGCREQAFTWYMNYQPSLMPPVVLHYTDPYTDPYSYLDNYFGQSVAYCNIEYCLEGVFDLDYVNF